MENIPDFGLGTWKIPKDKAADVVYSSIKDVGVRHIDCACDYGNEVEVGAGIKRAIDEGIVKRSDLWITSKLWNTFHRPEHVELACRKTLADLQLDHIDLYLIHFPISMKYVPIETRYPPEWIHDPSAASPCIVEDRVPKHLTWKGKNKRKKSDTMEVKMIGEEKGGTGKAKEVKKYGDDCDDDVEMGLTDDDVEMELTF